MGYQIGLFLSAFSLILGSFDAFSQGLSLIEKRAREMNELSKTLQKTQKTKPTPETAKPTQRKRSEATDTTTPVRNTQESKPATPGYAEPRLEYPGN